MHPAPRYIRIPALDAATVRTLDSLGLGHIALPSEHRAAVERRRCRAFGGDEGFQRWAVGGSLQPARLVVETLQRAHLFVASKFCVLHRRFQHADGLVVDLDRHRVGMPVLAAMRQREARRIAGSDTARRARPRRPSPASAPCARRRRASAAIPENPPARARPPRPACHAGAAKTRRSTARRDAPASRDAAAWPCAGGFAGQRGKLGDDAVGTEARSAVRVAPCVKSRPAGR